MFDLNIDNDKELEVKEEVVEGSGTNSELSGTSSSSVVNAAADDAAAEFNLFPSGGFVTRQLFPMGDVVVEERERQVELLQVGSSQPNSSTNQQWLNLAVSGSGSGSGPGPEQQQVRRSRRGPRSRSSQYRGVTFYRRTGRWESHIWDCGKQVYLGGFDTAHAAARAYDRAAIKFRGVDADINFNVADYDEDMKQMKNLTKEEFVHILRRQSTGFSRGSSRYRGITLHKCGRLEARMGQFLGKKTYNKAAIQCNGREAITNFEPIPYQGQIPIQASNGGDGQHLDLNLGISITIDGPKASYNMGAGESQTHHSHLQHANGKMPMNGSTTYSLQGVKTLYGQPLASRQSIITRSGLLSGRSEAYEDKVRDEKIEANSSARSLSNAWYMQSQGQGGGGGEGGSGGTTTSQVQVSSSTAASSGFSISTTAPPSTAFPLFTNTQTHVLPSSPPTSNSFHHYAWPG